MPQPIIAIHGGAGALARSAMTADKEREYTAALTAILSAGQAVLAAGGSAMEAVTEAVRLLEECPLFNAGVGAVFTSAGTHEMDAAVMDGAGLRCGAVAGVSRVRSPVAAARAVMEHSRHVLFVGEGAEAFARSQGLELVDPSYFSTEARREQLLRAQRDTPDAAVLDHDGQMRVAGVQQAVAKPAEREGAGREGVGREGEDREGTAASASSSAAAPQAVSGPLDDSRKFGTVGAVALDAQGRLAAATSTGGMTNKQPGRVGDSPLIGAGTYANHLCAVSATGTGEMFIRAVAAYDVAAQMEYAGAPLEQAAARVVDEKLPAIGGQGGLVAVDAEGNVALPFNTEGMYRGYARVGEVPVTAIYRD